MAKVTIRAIDDAAFGELPMGVKLEGGAAFPVFAAGSDPIRLHRFLLEAGGRLVVEDSGGGQAFYVRRGSIALAGATAEQGSSLVVEHRARAEIEALEPSELLCFAIGDANAQAVSRAGGHVHVLPAAAVPRCADFDGQGRVGGALFADSGCPTCEMWLHETVLHPGGHETPVHAHDEDEIIVVTSGEIILGRRAFGPDTAIAIARDTLYGFSSGEQGLVFINFRPSSPVYIPADKARAPIDEREFNLARMPSPQPITFASPAAAMAS